MSWQHSGDVLMLTYLQYGSTTSCPSGVVVSRNAEASWFFLVRVVLWVPFSIDTVGWVTWRASVLWQLFPKGSVLEQKRIKGKGVQPANPGSLRKWLFKWSVCDDGDGDDDVCLCTEDGRRCTSCWWPTHCCSTKTRSMRRLWVFAVICSHSVSQSAANKNSTWPEQK